MTTNDGLVGYDITSDPHFNKVFGIDVPTPHFHIFVANTNPKTGQILLNPSKALLLDGHPSGILDLRLLDEYFRKQGK